MKTTLSSIVSGYWLLAPVLFLLLSCGPPDSNRAQNDVSFPLPSSLVELASTDNMQVILICTNEDGEEKSSSLSIVNETVSGSIELQEGTTWRFVLQFLYETSSGNLLPIAFVDFGEKEVEKNMSLTYEADDILFDLVEEEGSIDPNLSGMIDVPVDCQEAYDCDGDGYTNFEELSEGSDPEDSESTPIDESECGNGVLETEEGCDDGNTTASDGCSATCQIETSTPVCGNGKEESGEGCDDGNTTSGDGCDAQCQSESITITVNLTEGQTVQDTILVTADASSRTSDIKRLLLTSPVISDTNSNSDAFDATYDTTGLTEDSTIQFIFYAQDEDNNEAYLIVNVLVDNTPNISSFGTDALIQNGSLATLTYIASNYSSLSIDNNVGTLSDSSGSISVSPTTTTTYTLTATRQSFTASKTVTITVNHQPTVDVPDANETLLGDDPSDGVSLSWTNSDSDTGDVLSSTISIYQGSDCLGSPLSTSSSTTQSQTTGSFTANDLNPRTDYSYTVTISDDKGGSSASSCQAFTTGDEGLVGWWRLNEGSGTTTRDSSGNSNNATLNGADGLPVWTDDPLMGYGLLFDGTDDYANINDINNDNDSLNLGAGDFTLETFVTFDDASDHQNLISSLYNDDEGKTSKSFLMILDTDQEFYLRYYGAYRNSDSDYNSFDLNGIIPLTLNKWHHLVAVREEGEFRLYVNGKLDNERSDNVEGTIVTNNGLWELGRYNGGDQQLNGLLDEAVIYNRTLSTQEIRDLCQSKEDLSIDSEQALRCASDDLPAQLEPTNNITLSPTETTLSWEVPAFDSTSTFDHYDLCYSTTIDLTPDLACDNPQTPTDSYYVLESLTANTDYSWKVRTCYTDGTCTSYSSVWSFSTDDAL